MSYCSCIQRQRNPHLHDEASKEPFFSKQNDSNKPGQKNTFFQAKLSVNEPGDKYEREADSVATAIVNQPSGKNSIQEKEKNKKISPVQAKQAGTANAVSSQVSSRIENSSGKGSSLPPKTLHEMNSSFGADFSGVNIHQDNEATSLNQELQAQAFTHGNDIYFNEGKYNPQSKQGKSLLAHELTHVVQQTTLQNRTVQRFGFSDLCKNDTVIDDTVVRGYINNALDNSNPSPGDSSNLKNAWLNLRAQRENHCCDSNLAAAEHYMYARHLVADGWEPYALVMAMIVNYDTWGKYLMPKTGDCPITRPSTGLMGWGINGATEGLADYYYPRPQ